MVYEVKMIELFEKKLKLLPENKREDILSRLRKLSLNPFIGKPLGYKFLRELKLDKFRVYYLIFETELVVLIITTGDKKDQKDTIKYLRNNIQTFRKLVNFK
jgi:mRNA-degrading endonuclease RelE of RelBE toxin-antitoxin system